MGVKVHENLPRNIFNPKKLNDQWNQTSIVIKSNNQLGLSCAKLRPAWASYQLAFVWLAFTEAANYAYFSCLLCLTIHT